MGLSELYLVQPQQFPHGKAMAMAAGADDVLTNATVVGSLAEAVAECDLLIGTSVRVREIPRPMLDPRQAAVQVHSEASSKAAIIFGREYAGLTNDELALCHYHLMIPANAEYSSLNLAMAVQVVCYELRMAYLGEQTLEHRQHDSYATGRDIDYFYQHLEKTLREIAFLHPNHPERIMARLKRLFARVRLERLEVNLLRGMLTAIDKVSKVD